MEGTMIRPNYRDLYPSELTLEERGLQMAEIEAKIRRRLLQEKEQPRLP